MIEVILMERIERLGHMGQVVKVKPGFARNFLLPQKKALRATKINLEHFEKQRATLEANNATEREKAQAMGAKMDGLTLVVIRQASETGQLYGSVSARDVADAAAETKQKIDRNQVQIDAPIKALGLFPVKIKLHPEVSIKIMVNVARSPEEAVVQAEKGAAFTKAAAEKASVEAAFGAPVSGEEGEAAGKKPKKAKAAKAEAKAGKTEAKAEHVHEEKADGEAKAKKPRAKKTAKE